MTSVPNSGPLASGFPATASLDDAPAMVAGARQVVALSPDGEVEELTLAAAAMRVRRQPPLICHGRAFTRRLGLDAVAAFDVLELFAFVRPARFCVPTPRGLAEALDLPVPDGLESDALALQRAVRRLLAMLTEPGREEASDPVAFAWEMGRAGWLWAPAVLAALGRPEGPDKAGARAGLRVWSRIKEWQEGPPEPPPAHHPVDPEEARRRLAQMLASSVPGKVAEPRPQQADYSSAVSAAFAPRPAPDSPTVVLAEAGTGVGKTLGYLAPATVWAEKNGGTVWISTYTRNLQHQIDAELDRLYPEPATKARKVVLRKGRENYLCLLNLEDAIRAMTFQPHHAIGVGLMARWAAATRDGDMTGGDFPGWLVDIAGRGRTLGLADRRGECIFSACDHYSRCFIEKSIRRARKADIVIANHALVMVQAALGGGEDATLPSRYVFDEGHHVFDAADSAFCGHLTGRETQELRRWLLGAEEGGRSRARGLKRRLEDLVANDEEALALLDAVLMGARVLPGDGWNARLSADNPQGPTERFLLHARQQVHARTNGQGTPYSLEADKGYPVDGLLEAATALEEALSRLSEPIAGLARRLAKRLEDEGEQLDPDQRRRIDALSRSLQRRGVMTVEGWRAMLRSLPVETPPAFVDWFAVERIDGRDVDVGLYRHWIDPTVPFAEALAGPAHGIVVTSATLTDGTGDVEQDWRAAEDRSGASHLPRPAIRAQVPSPFDYPRNTRVMVVTDVRKDDLGQVAAAYRSLFLAAGGGGLGLFTAISRLRAVYDRIVEPLEVAGVPLHAQHVDPLDVSTLIDIFRNEEHACLLGTDAVRDGVDVPGRSLRLIVFDRVPWPRPDILHRARRDAFGRRRYEDMIARLRLKQAFGRLVRRADDTGVFVLLDPMMPSRLFGAFPEGVEVRRVGLKQAVDETAEFLRGW
ncbi:ATP-dependent DNA helicase [Azospirillum thermophilum]|uniref:ATP-dependent DNA helicase n=2 Tax=Azospirillum thermophilum TaxID=2202148 RepID=A0A2S2CSZ4_9PROT|nr:ATP-dependent DNA helicase [Azospirillum thermophilum]